MSHLDGNVLGGVLGDLFTVDMTMAMGQCASCDTRSSIAQAMVYADAPGMIARCPSCGQVIMRLVHGEGRAWLDLRGVRYLELPMPE